MSLRRYLKCRDSGIEWLGKVPAHWPILRLRFVAEFNPSKSEIGHLDRNTVVSFIPMEAIGEDGNLSVDQTRLLSQVENGYTYFRDGDVAFAKITPCFENGKGAMMHGLISGLGFGTTELIVARPRPGVACGRYLHWLFSSLPFRKFGEGAMYGAGGQKRVPENFARDFAIAFPPIVEQTEVADFLHRETAKIDALIAEQEKLLVLLAEKRRATISHAVTRGLNPDAPTKDSCVAWLGKVPAHWRVSALSYVARIETGATPDRGRLDFWGGSIPWIKTGEINWIPISETEEHITAAAIGNSSVKIAKAGTLMMAMYGQGATRGRVALLEIEATYNQACAAISFGPAIEAEYGRYFFMAAYDHVRESGNETSQMNLGAGIISKFRISVPPIQEQLRIASFLDAEITKVAALEDNAKRGITLLRERRSALITAAVTGKVDVRNAIPDALAA